MTAASNGSYIDRFSVRGYPGLINWSYFAQEHETYDSFVFAAPDTQAGTPGSMSFNTPPATQNYYGSQADLTYRIWDQLAPGELATQILWGSMSSNPVYTGAGVPAIDFSTDGSYISTDNIVEASLVDTDTDGTSAYKEVFVATPQTVTNVAGVDIAGPDLFIGFGTEHGVETNMGCGTDCTFDRDERFYNAVVGLKRRSEGVRNTDMKGIYAVMTDSVENACPDGFATNNDAVAMGGTGEICTATNQFLLKNVALVMMSGIEGNGLVNPGGKWSACDIIYMDETGLARDYDAGSYSTTDLSGIFTYVVDDANQADPFKCEYTTETSSGYKNNLVIKLFDANTNAELEKLKFKVSNSGRYIQGREMTWDHASGPEVASSGDPSYERGTSFGLRLDTDSNLVNYFSLLTGPGSNPRSALGGQTYLGFFKGASFTTSAAESVFHEGAKFAITFNDDVGQTCIFKEYLDNAAVSVDPADYLNVQHIDEAGVFTTDGADCTYALNTDPASPMLTLNLVDGQDTTVVDFVVSDDRNTILLGLTKSDGAEVVNQPVTLTYAHFGSGLAIKHDPDTATTDEVIAQWFALEPAAREPAARPPYDYNGDGTSDLLLRHSSGAWYMYLMNGSTVIGQDYAAMATSSDWQPQALEDFDGDGKTDVLLRHAAGYWYLYLMDGSAVKGQGYAAITAHGDWQPKAFKDFDGDGKTDVLLRHAAGYWYLYLMDGSTIKGQGYAPMTAHGDWQPKAFEDFDGDGKVDVLLRHAAGYWYMYLMDGLSVKLQNYTAKTASADWTPEAFEDFDGDGKTDVLLRHTAGYWYMYLMDGATVKGQDYAALSAFADWIPQAYEDFDGDGKTDVLLRHTAGYWYTYLMDGLSIKGQDYVAISSSNDWTPKIFEDFDNDGNTDVLLRHVTTGYWYMNLLNGTSVKSDDYTSMTVSSDWELKK